MIRFYKDMFKYTARFGETIYKLQLLDEENLAKNVTLHKYRFEKKEKEAIDTPKMVYFGAPDFETRKILEGENFLFAGHQGDKVILVKSPVVDDVITRETYGTINLASFFINMLVVTDAIIDSLANDFAEKDDDTILFEYDSKFEISEKYPRIASLDYEKRIAVYQINDELSIAI
jgi:hypothetical protein